MRVFFIHLNGRVALSIGDHDRDEFETPFLQSSLNPSIVVRFA